MKILSKSWDAATKTNCLDERISSNTKSQKVDFNSWIFKNIDIKKGDSILELCCGVGTQTEKLGQLIGEKGQIVAVDIENESLNKLRKRLQDFPGSLQILHSNIDDIDTSLTRLSLKKNFFDVIFVSYGLYYSQDATSLLETLSSWMSSHGRLVVVGPHGNNNNELFELLEASEVNLSNFTLFSSKRFMYEKVIPWCAKHFEHTQLFSLNNEVVWESPDEVLSYWRNTIFFEEDKEPIVEKNLRNHFRKYSNFTNKKQVMVLEAKGVL